jgi:pimeloyl-ACP methyl ester carboxylesterase
VVGAFVEALIGRLAPGAKASAGGRGTDGRGDRAALHAHAREGTLMPADGQQIRFLQERRRSEHRVRHLGQRTALVKAANWMSHVEFDWQSPVWSPLLRELSRTRTLVRYDERGCGLSDWDAELSFEAWVRDLEAVVDAAGIERFPLLGISQGASIAIAYAVRHPERVERLILHGGYARGRLMRGATREDHEEAEATIKLAELGWGKQNPVFRQYFTDQFIPGGSPEQRHWFNELERVSTSPRNAARFMRVFNDIDVVALLRGWRARPSCCTRSARNAWPSRKASSSRASFPAPASCRSTAAITCCSSPSRSGAAGSMRSSRSCRNRRGTSPRSTRSRAASATCSS